MAWAPEILIRAQVATVATTFVACAFRASFSKSASLTSAPSTRPKLNSGSACGAMRKMCLNRMMPAASCVTPASTCDRRVRRRTRAFTHRAVAVSAARATFCAVDASPATTGARHGARRASKRSASCKSQQKPIILRVFQCAGLTIFCQDCWTMSTVFLRSGGAIFEEVYSDARSSCTKVGNKNSRFFPVGLPALPEASSRLQGGLARAPGGSRSKPVFSSGSEQRQRARPA